jgi:hypothetical protein
MRLVHNDKNDNELREVLELLAQATGRFTIEGNQLILTSAFQIVDEDKAQFVEEVAKEQADIDDQQTVGEFRQFRYGANDTLRVALIREGKTPLQVSPVLGFRSFQLQDVQTYPTVDRWTSITDEFLSDNPDSLTTAEREVRRAAFVELVTYETYADEDRQDAGSYDSLRDFIADNATDLEDEALSGLGELVQMRI